MATVYFTNNADSGDGSLRAAISAAASGDVVTYSDSAFANTDDIVIPLSSVLVTPTYKDITIDGREKRIVLDGQGVSLLLRAGTTNQSLVHNFINIDFINGYSDSYKAPVNITRVTAMFKGCRILGGKSSVSNAGIYAEYEATVTMVDCLVSGCNRTGVNIGSSGSNEVIIKRCTIVGNVIDISVNNASTANSITDCLIASKTGPGSTDIITTLPSTCGFVAPCPDTIDPESWTNTLWQSWDFRLTPESPYLAGAETVEAGAVDILGHDRKENGAFGAYEGSWIIAPSVIDANTTVDYIEALTGTTLTFTSDCFLSIRNSAYLDSTEITGNGYLAVPSLSDVANATIAETVRVCEYSAGVLDVSATINEDLATIAVTKTQDKAVVVEGSNNGGVSWSPCVLVENSTTLPSAKAYKFRVFDGEKFVETQVIPRTYYYVSQLPEGDFAEPSDWSLDKAGTKVCTDAPTIADGTFDCR